MKTFKYFSTLIVPFFVYISFTSKDWLKYTPAIILFGLVLVIGIAFLETFNYIEYYGLLRKKNEYSRYEKVKRNYSWNSNHQVIQISLFNVSRHSDHHSNESKHYQILKSVPESPQMRTEYPSMMLLSFYLPFWFWLMNKNLKKIS